MNVYILSDTENKMWLF